MKIAALVPARSGSKGIPGKNWKDFCGKPLYQWTLDAANDSKLFDKIILSTDSEAYLGGFRTHKGLLHDGVNFIDEKRPSELCDDAASLDDVLVYYQRENPDIDLWCLLQPTSPLRTAEDIQNAHKMMLEEEGDDYKYDSLVSVTPHPVMAWIGNSVGLPGTDEPQAIATYRINKRPNRQDRKDWYLENGAIYFTRKYVIEHCKIRLHGFIGLYSMPKERSIDLDEPIDWEIAEGIMRRRLNNGVA